MSAEALWYLSRASGVVSIVLFTAVMVLGIVTAGRAGATTAHRTTILRLHRSITLVALVFLVIHIATAILDGYVDLEWIDVFVPFVSAFDPLWIGFGALAVDLLLAVSITSALRRHLPVRLWRIIHLASYAMWPVAIVHGLFTEGGDGTTAWMLTVTALCIAAVGGALIFRLARRPVADTAARHRAIARHTRVAEPLTRGTVR